MNKTKKTYGIKGFMEYQAVIKVGKSRMKVPFSDGSMTAMGVVPCTFTTERFMVQHAIENSDEFKRGLIYIVNSIPLDGKVEIERPSPRPTGPTPEPIPGPTPEPIPGPTPEPIPGPTPEPIAELNPEPIPDTAPEPAPSTESEEQPATVQVATEEGVVEKPVEEVWPPKSEEPDAPLTQVEFASNDEAKDYLEQNFGLVRSKLRNREDIFNAGKANGVEIIFI